VGAALDYAIARVAREYKANVGKNAVSFSIVGEGAANWNKIKHNAFEGIHDGKPRVELDASKAAVKMHKSGVDMVTYYESTIKRDRTADNPKYLNTLEKILVFDELYESYPWLRDAHVQGIRDKKETAAGFVEDYEERGIGDITLNFANSRGENPFQSEAFDGDSKRILLHEIQHIIQNVEGFEYGWGKPYAERPGELESRNVERRSEYSEEGRRIHPFNKTLELDASFSVGSGGITLESETTAWGNQLSEYLDGKTPLKNRDMRVCTTPAVLRMLGAKPHDLVMTPGVIDKVIGGKHTVPREALEQLPAAIADPVCVAVSDTNGSVEVITSLMENGNNVLVAVELNAGSRESRQLKVNRITSLYGKESIGKFITHPMLYWSKAKAREWLANYGLQLPTTGLPKANSKGKLLKPDDLVKWKEKNGINFSTQGDEIKSQAQRFIASGQAAQARFWEATSKRIGKEIVSEANESVNFSIFSPSEAEGIHALQSITKGAKEARFRSDTLNQDVILELGRAGKEKANGKVTGYYGLNHLIAQRLVEGDSMEEACYTAVKSVLAAVDGEIAKKNIAEDRRILTLDRYHAAISLSWNGEKGAWMISGFKENSKNTSADDRKKAAYLASNYAVDQFGCFEGLGAALDYAIARVAREYKANVGKNAVS
ncbi:MAG: hypothetical protein RR138_07300, partial [Akkermansia sp.]